MENIELENHERQLKEAIRKLTIFGFWLGTRLKYVLENHFELQTTC